MSSLGLFVPAREEERSWLDGGMEKVEVKTSGALTGEEVRDFYQSMFQQEDEGGKKKENRRTSRRTSRRPERRRWVRDSGAAPPAGPTEGYRLLRCAQQGDVSGVEALLRRGCDVHFRDDFKWTALMCACYSGKSQTVQVLLQGGARWRGYTDQQGRDARALALLAGHDDIVMQLEHCDITHTPHTPADSTLHSPAPLLHWCEVCEMNYSEATPAHLSSTLHQFSVRRSPSAPHYCLTPSSASYRMMLRLGWDPRSGLGPGHTGRRHPVGTVLKSDKAGFGFGDKPRSKVTHFGANDTQALRRVPMKPEDRAGRGTTLSTKHKRRKEEEKEKQWERDYRSSFNVDF